MSLPHSPLQGAAAARRIGLLILLSLGPLWLVGMFDRGLWTPDEPREADIAWRMSLQSDRSVPQLAGSPFLEKPPLSYWMSGAALAVLGDSSASARAPNLLYALIATFSVGALAFSMLGEVSAAVFAAVVAGSALLAFRVSVWLAPDAALLAGNALALLGAWHGYRAAPGRRKALAYTLMHLGAAIGFMAKSAPGWLVPALALIAMIAWERRWSELRRWELYVGFALQALLIGPWVLSVARGTDGAAALQALFWNNVVGRFTKVSGPAALDYTTGHQNWPGKYGLELPVYLLPWTLIVLAALLKTRSQLQPSSPHPGAWRFALAACVPFLVLLSFAATARDVYAAPALLGFGLLAGLWLHAAQRAPASVDRVMLVASRYLVLILAGGFAAALGVLARIGGNASLRLWIAAALIVLTALVSARLAALAQRQNTLARSVGWTYVAYGGALLITLLTVSPVVDRWQDLTLLARVISTETRQQPLALLDPDETTLAVFDHGLATPFTVLRSTDGTGAAVRAWFDSHGRNARVLVLMPGHAPGPLSSWLDDRRAARSGTAAQLVSEGTAVLAHTYALPQGRWYALLAPPG